jgi:hypothetical protein
MPLKKVLTLHFDWRAGKGEVLSSITRNSVIYIQRIHDNRSIAHLFWSRQLWVVVIMYAARNNRVRMVVAVE